MYSKPTNSRKTLKKYLVSLVVMAMLSVFVMPGKSRAFLSWDWIQNQFKPDKYCNPTMTMFENIAHDQPQQSIVRFGYNYDTVRFLKVFYNVFGVSPDTAMRCLSTIPLTNVSTIGLACTVLTGAPSEVDCGNFLLTSNNDPNNPDKYATNPGNGSLLSLYYALDRGTKNLGNPLDLNYFAYKSLEKVPFVGKTFAQGANEYGAPFVADVYFAWRIVRNLSFGVFAILMLIVGVMMINRTKLNPQAVVTIQYALPKIIIAVILIAFSYPIGAIIVTFVWYIKGALWGIVLSQGFAGAGAAQQEVWGAYFKTDGTFNIGLYAMQMFLSIFVTMGVGLLALLLALILMMIICVQLLIIIIKMAIYYAKMLLEVVLSPISFVYSAIPGNDDAAMGWFKKMFAYALSVCALGILPLLVFFIGLAVSVSLQGPPIPPPSVAAGNNIFLIIGQVFSSGANIGVSSMLAMVASPMIMYVGLSMTLKLPAQIEETITGVKKKR